MQIGIPRALGYYMYFPFWYGFFNDLGIEVVVSRTSTKELLSKGSALVVPETCLPVKVYMGHVLDLIENKGVKHIYSPSIQSVDFKIYNCSKLRGLPDLVRNVIKKDFTLVEPTLDKSVKNQGLYQFLYESVEPFGITDKKRIKKASKAGWSCYNKYLELMQKGVKFADAIAFATGKKETVSPVEKKHDVNVAVISHQYNVFDDQLSMRLITKLEKMNVNVYTADNISREEQLNGIKKLETVLYWANEFEMTGTAGHYMHTDPADGLVTVTAFGCGPDSLMIERITRYAKHAKVPVLNITLDEHTGEAGLITRLEAFTDMLIRRKRILNGQIPSHLKVDRELELTKTQ